MTKKYLNVAYKDRDLAKRLGARWDPAVNRWYCMPGSSLSKVYSWRAEAKIVATTTRDTGTAASTMRIAHARTPVSRNFQLPLSL